MSRKLPFTEAAVRRAAKGIKDAGLPVSRIDIDPNTGKISIVLGDRVVLPGAGIPAPAMTNEWDEVLDAS